MTVKWNNELVLARTRLGMMRGVSRWIHDVEDRAVKLIQGPPKTGRLYRRRGIVHQASAPGEAPATDTGRLVNARRIDLSESEISGTLTFSTFYAAFLEFGTKKMAPRPFARRALTESIPGGVAMLQEEVDAALK